MITHGVTEILCSHYVKVSPPLCDRPAEWSQAVVNCIACIGDGLLRIIRHDICQFLLGKHHETEIRTEKQHEEEMKERWPDTTVSSAFHHEPATLPDSLHGRLRRRL